MRELELFREYMGRLRLQKLKATHATLLSDGNDIAMREARVLAREAAQLEKLMEDIRELEKDPNEFVIQHLK